MKTPSVVKHWGKLTSWPQRGIPLHPYGSAWMTTNKSESRWFIEARNGARIQLAPWESREHRRRGRCPAEVLSYPLVEIDVELVQGDVRSCDKDLLDERIDPLEHRQVECLRAVLVQVWRQLPSTIPHTVSLPGHRPYLPRIFNRLPLHLADRASDSQIPTLEGLRHEGDVSGAQWTLSVYSAARGLWYRPRTQSEKASNTERERTRGGRRERQKGEGPRGGAAGLGRKGRRCCNGYAHRGGNK